MFPRTFLLLCVAACALVAGGCATDNSVKTPVPPAPTNHLAAH